jgi:membrane protein
MGSLARSLVEHPRVTALLHLARRSLERMVEVELVDRAVALASLAFTALVPVAVIASSIVPGIDRASFADSIVNRFDLDAQTASVVREAFSASQSVGSSVSVLGILLVIGSALSFTRGLQRAYERAWRLPALGVRATPAGLIWLAGLIVLGSAFREIRAALIATSRPIFSILVALGFAAVIWLGSPWILLSRRVPWRRLVPTSIVTAVAMTALSAASLVYMPRSIAASAASYGTIGVAISLVSWLVGAGFVLVGCAAIGAVLGDPAGDATLAESGQERITLGPAE